LKKLWTFLQRRFQRLREIVARRALHEWRAFVGVSLKIG